MVASSGPESGREAPKRQDNSMWKLAAIACVSALSAAASAQALMSLDHGRSALSLRAAQSATAPVIAEPAPATGQPASVVKAADGHYWAEAAVNGHEVHFLVDTGATAVALTADDAKRLGFNPAGLAFTYQVTTANGPTRAARVKLASVSVAGAQVADVEAFVIEQGLQTSLLGMTYLGRLSQFEATKTSLILRP
jgi:aspartyl protease family protein